MTVLSGVTVHITGGVDADVALFLAAWVTTATGGLGDVFLCRRLRRELC